MEPKISVVITAHNRRDYLLECIKSVLDQSLSRELYEIIVVKNFDEPYIDDFIDKNNLIRIKANSDAIGEKFVLGAKRSSGDVLCILNDDDLFHKNKLQFILDVFNKNYDLLYCHNSFLEIGKQGEIKNYEVALEDFILNTMSVDKKSIKKVLSGLNTFNDSCISIKRKVIMEYKEVLVNTRANQDTILFLLAFKMGGLLMGSNKKLTYYRVHSSTSTFRSDDLELNIEKFNSLVDKRRDSYRYILPLFDDENFLYRYVKCNYRSNFIQGLIFRDVKRTQVLTELLKFTKCPLQTHFKTRFHLIIILLLKVLNKNLIYRYIAEYIFKYY
jgi:glycosyltransferase involved in cell wall biosynthesis